MPSYNLITEFSDEQDPENINTSPTWVIAVARLKNRLTFDRFKNATAHSDNSDLSDTFGHPFVTSDCLRMDIGQNKGNHVSSLSASFAGGDTKYMDEIFPGDWILAWIVQHEDKAQELTERIKNNEACNRFDDGLKFVGRVQSIRKQLGQQAGGLRTTSYNLTATGFNELDAETFFDPAFSDSQQGNIAEWITRLGNSLQEFITVNEKAQGITTNKAIPTLLELLLGQGIPPEANKTVDGVSQAHGLTQNKEAPYAYLVPQMVGNWLNKKVPNGRPKLAYADILELLYGIQKYSDINSVLDTGTSAVFTPDNTFGTGTRRFTGTEMTGSFTPTTVALQNKTVWTALNQFLNPAVNEMYTTLRINGAEEVVPTLVLRQKPFSTNVFKRNFAQKISQRNATIVANRYSDVIGSFNAQAQNPAPLLGAQIPQFDTKPPEITPFLNLPRWKVHPILVQALDVGRTDAMRFNFIHVYGETTSQQGIADRTVQLVSNPPISDDADIKLHGLRSINQMVSCSLNDAAGGASRQWMELIADFNIGLHLSLSGTMVLKGISAPIAVGDNLEFDGIVYHIENVGHSCSIQGGQKNFTTNLSLSYGQKAESATEPPLEASDSNSIDSVIYPIKPDSLFDGQINRFDAVKTTNDPGSTEENRVSPTGATLAVE